MCADGTNPTKGSEEIPTDATEKASSGWARRRFLGAAALGTAAAAFLSGADLGKVSFKPLAAYADELSDLNCTANDVRIVGPGIVLNEPCDCTGTFNAQVQFHIINNTGTTRYCVTVHLCAGGLEPQRDIVVGDIPANFDGPKTVTIEGYHCGQGLVCFGAAGSQPDGSFLKGEACPAGQCCSTITWNVKASDPCPDTTRQISSKCRHQQICIQGRGVTTLDCDTSLDGVQTACTAVCGESTTLRLCTTSNASFGPFTFSLTSDPATTISADSGTGSCRSYTVGPITANTTFTGTVTDASGCAKSASVTLTSTAIPAPQISLTALSCDGLASLSVSNAASFPAGTTFSWTLGSDTTVVATGTSVQITLTQGVTTTVVVTTSNGFAACDTSATLDVAVPADLAVSLALTDAPCSGVLTLTATASGGVAPYTYSYNGGPSTSSNTLTVQPQLDGVCRSVSVVVTDSVGCTATSNTVSFSQCVTTTACTPP